ncbi:TetR/AcrR family transcriptional regulator [Solimonas sp. K1W22B-7]|uniref:TetR/AcrR family transcriptional regulator n=1 Tax=Solimonas sp. K1W22B-7 TaxID=2303331 RepID=UPI000E3355DE|nr:TetR/AcrR family transcriptional regulator [Solimonas sp. K1W22B-7]AXQ28502.1 TetR/AcrR family transcriptional regulator [Solimonas sp. K1W22B-7]
MADGTTFPGRKPQKRKRNPDRTRTAILEAAGKLLAQDWSEGLSVSRVAQLAGVNRGTAYQHFPTREQLLDETTTWVSDRLRQAVFGDQPADQDVRQIDPQNVADQMVKFAMGNPDLCRVWLFEVLSSNRADRDPFWKQYRSQLESFAETDLAQPGIDVEVQAVIMLIGTFLWPVFARGQARTAKDREQLSKRFSNELLRLSLHGTMRPEKFPALNARVASTPGEGKRSK